MMAANSQQFTQMLEMFMNKDKDKAKTQKEKQRIIHEKAYKKVDKFDGLDKNYKKFSQSFSTCTKIADVPTSEMMKTIQVEEQEISTEEMIVKCAGTLINSDLEAAYIKERSIELYDMLTLVCEGDAHQLVESVEGDGFAAWQKLVRAYTMNTTAKTMGRVIAVVSPPKVTDLSTMRGKIEEWESMERELKNENKESIPESFRTAILTTMCPPSIQEIIFQQSTPKQSFKDLKEKIINITANRVALMNGPVPMDIGNTNTMNNMNQNFQQQFGQFGYQQPGHAYQNQPGFVGQIQTQGTQFQHQQGSEGQMSCSPCGGNWGDFDMNMVGRNTQCYTCFQYGHISRDCPTVKGGGKGGKANGKGDFYKGGGKGQDQNYKGGFKGQGKGFPDGGYKGKGKGFQGSCYKCGKFGHSQNNCRSVNHVDGSFIDWGPEAEMEKTQEQTQEQPKGIGSVWCWAANVNKEIDWPKMNIEVNNTNKSKINHVKRWKKIETTNRFSTFDSDDEDDVPEINEPAGDEHQKPPGLENIQKVKTVNAVQVKM